MYIHVHEAHLLYMYMYIHVHEAHLLYMYMKYINVHVYTCNSV